jgi:molecular chaperone DnaK (HSP70)
MRKQQRQLHELEADSQQNIQQLTSRNNSLISELETSKNVGSEQELKLQIATERLLPVIDEITYKITESNALPENETGIQDTQLSGKSVRLTSTREDSEGLAIDSDDLVLLIQTLQTIKVDLYSASPLSSSLIDQAKHNEEKMSLQDQMIRDLTTTRNAALEQVKNLEAKIETCQTKLSVETAEKHNIDKRLSQLESDYASLERQNENLIIQEKELQEQVQLCRQELEEKIIFMEECQEERQVIQRQLLAYKDNNVRGWINKFLDKILPQDERLSPAKKEVVC